MNECRGKMREIGCAVLIPTYNNGTTVSAVIDDVLQYCDSVIVVNDGSTDETQILLAQRKDIKFITYARNRGKGYALKTGFQQAQEMGFRYLITIDSDGQHYADDIPLFVEEIEKNPDVLIIGARNLEMTNMPGKNTFANKFSNFWFKVETGITLCDTQSGYRLYPLRQLENMRFITSKYEFEVEVIVRAAWRGVEVKNIPIKVYYQESEKRITHFRPFRDFTRISVLNTFLVTVALLYYYPLLFIKSLNIKTIRAFFDKQIIHSKESNLKIALSVGLGVFCGIIPLWGYQMITAGVLAHLFKLNKVISVVSSNISIPPMIPLILYMSLLFGGVLLGTSTFISISGVTFESLYTSIFQYVVGSVALAVVCGITIGGVVFFVLKSCGRKVNG